MTVRYTQLASPLGQLLLAADKDALRLLQFPQPRYPVRPGPDWHPGRNAVLDAACEQLDAWFAGQRRNFDLPLAKLGTPFQESVWQALTEIPWGQTRSYGELARHLGKPKASRAVGAANGRNPLPIIRPCHRVIGADGSLTGFGGGLAAKRWLLRHEGALPADELFPAKV